jgi:SPP1 gp7 family putative phage head morphogenesis protein
MENQALFDRQIEHLVRSRLYAKDVLKVVENLGRDHRSRLIQFFRKKETEKFKVEVERYLRALTSTAGTAVSDFIYAELGFQTQTVNRSVKSFYDVKTPSRDAVAKRIVESPMRFSLTGDKTPPLQTSLSRLGQSELARLNREVRVGIAQGLPQSSIESRIVKAARLTENQARTLVTTSFTHAQELVAESFWEENGDLLLGYTFTAILDGSTTELCSSNDGTFFPKDDVKLKPPLHWGCRSSLVPVLKGYQALMETTSPRVDKDALLEVKPSNFNGETAARESFEQWLRRQTFAKQVEMLQTEENVSLFQRGSLRLKDFFSSVAKPIGIGTLRKLDAASTFRTSQTNLDPEIRLSVTRPYELVRSTDQTDALRQLVLKDSANAMQSLSLVDYRGTSLPGKRESRRRSRNELDERNSQFNPFTGEVQSSYYYNPDYVVFTERLDLVSNSKTLTRAQKTWIREFVDSIGDELSTNQKAAVVEALRLTFERAAQDGAGRWVNYAAVFRAEMNFSTVNVSRLLDRRSRERDELFMAFGSPKDSARVQVLGEYVTFDDLMRNKLANQNFIRDWDKQKGRELARRLYYPSISERRLGVAPLRTYLLGLRPKPKSPPKEFVKWVEENIPGVKNIKFGSMKFSNVIAGWINNIPGVKEYRSLNDWWSKPTDPLLVRAKRAISEEIQTILDLQFLRMRDRRTIVDRLTTSVLKDDDQIKALQGLMKTIATGVMTDYDGLAIELGKSIYKSFRPVLPWAKPSLADYHKDGSAFLEALRDQGVIRVQSRGVVRRSTLDLETGRLGGNYKDTVSREVSIIDPELLQLQKAARKIVLADRIGVVDEQQKYYVKAGSKTYFDSRGQNTGRPIITRSAAPFYDDRLIDADFAAMLNHTMSTRFVVDNEFASFFLDVARYRDVRGRSAYYDDINLFRHEIVKRGELGYGLLETLKYHLSRQGSFSVHARIDGRGRVYYEGYLTPTGGEVVRPFLNSAAAKSMTPGGLHQIKTSLGALIGGKTEGLTTAGRLAAFRRHEKDFLELGELISATTQRDRRIREFLEHPLVRATDGEEVAKLARFALEYYRVHRHMGGNFSDTARLARYKTQLMGEVDASASALQMISLATGDRRSAAMSNIVPTRQKQRVYDIVAQEVASDPRFLKLMETNNLNLSWGDLQKAAKYLVMISYYGAGATGQRARVTQELASVLRKRDIAFVTRKEQLEALRLIDAQMKVAKSIGADEVVEQLKSFKKDFNAFVASRDNPSAALINEAQEIHPDLFAFIERLTNRQGSFAGPDVFKDIAVLMSEKLTEQTPSAERYILFWKRVGQRFAEETNKVDLPWVTFDGKTMWQRYRPKVQEEIRFRDPVTGRFVRNVYQTTSDEDTLLGRGSIGDVRLGAGVNGTHANDASIVRQFHLWGRRNGIETTTIHDAFFTNINDLDRSIQAILEIYADAANSNQIENTLKAMLANGLSRKSYNEFLEQARRQSMIGNPLTKEEILRPLKPGEDRYGIGP